MSLADVNREQEAHRCACVRLSARDCIRARYPGHYGDEAWDEDRDPYEEDEVCECSCHDHEYEGEEDDDG